MARRRCRGDETHPLVGREPPGNGEAIVVADHRDNVVDLKVQPGTGHPAQPRAGNQAGGP